MNCLIILSVSSFLSIDIFSFYEPVQAKHFRNSNRILDCADDCQMQCETPTWPPHAEYYPHAAIQSQRHQIQTIKICKKKFAKKKIATRATIRTKSNQRKPNLGHLHAANFHFKTDTQVGENGPQWVPSTPSGSPLPPVGDTV